MRSRQRGSALLDATQSLTPGIYRSLMMPYSEGRPHTSIYLKRNCHVLKSRLLFWAMEVVFTGTSAIDIQSLGVATPMLKSMDLSYTPLKYGNSVGSNPL